MKRGLHLCAPTRDNAPHRTRQFDRNNRNTTMEKTTHASIYQLEDGRFKIDTRAKDPRTGKLKRVRETLPEGTALAEAVMRRDAIKEEIRGEPRHEPTRLTLAEYASSWLERKAPRLKPNTLKTYVQIMTDVIIPQLGTLYADVIVRADVEEWVVWAESRQQSNGKPYSDATLKKWWTTLSVLLKDLAADVGIADPTARIERPSSSRRNVREKQTLTAESLRIFLDAAKEHTPSRHTELLTLAYTGIRVGELYALKWDDVDFGRRVLTINSSVSAGELTETTKTGSAREVAIPNVVVEAIQEHRQQMIREQHRGLASGLLFPSNANTPRTNSSLTKPIRRIVEETELDIIPSPQVLRRTYNTLMVRAGVDRVVLRSQIGHVSEAMTERYMGVSDEDKHKAVRDVFQS